MKATKKNEKFIALLIVTLALIVLVATSCGPPPKIMTSHRYLGEDKSVKFMLQRADKQAGEVAKEMLTGEKEDDLFHFWVRVCDLGPGTAEENCKDSLLVQYVYPESIY